MYPEETSLYHAILAGALVLASFMAASLITILYYQKRKSALAKTRVRLEINALEKERARIAKDLHDDLGSSLSAIKLGLHSLHLASERERQLVGASETYIDEAMLKLRRISFNLMPGVLERKGLRQALYEFIDMIEQPGVIKINFRSASPTLCNEKAIHIYRMVQEALTNIVKHSGATEATVELKTTKNTIILHIRDNGIGFDKNAKIKSPSGLGLQNILARAEVLNARILLSAAPGAGTSYFIQIPLNT